MSFRAVPPRVRWALADGINAFLPNGRDMRATLRIKKAFKLEVIRLAGAEGPLSGKYIAGGPSIRVDVSEEALDLIKALAESPKPLRDGSEFSPQLRMDLIEWLEGDATDPGEGTPTSDTVEDWIPGGPK